MVFGTDVPHVPRAEQETIAALKDRGWPEPELEDIFGKTARRLLA
jgi:hypothetical protein